MHIQRSMFPPGYTGHQAGRHSVVGTSNPAAFEFPAPVGCGLGGLQADIRASHTHSRESEKPSIIDSPAELYTIPRLDEEPIPFSSNGSRSSNSSIPSKPIALSYCNPAYVRSANISQKHQESSRSPEIEVDCKRNPGFHRSDILTFEGKGTGYAVGHNTKTNIWENDNLCLNRTEYRECFGSIPSTHGRGI